MLINFLTVENNVCLLSPLLLQSDSLICWCRLGAGRLGGGFESVGRLSLWQARREGSALKRHPSGLGTARAASHFLLMTSYMAGVVQKNIWWRWKNTIMGFLELSFIFFCWRLVLVTRWKSRSSWGMHSHRAWRRQFWFATQPAGELGRLGNKADILVFGCCSLEQAEE